MSGIARTLDIFVGVCACHPPLPPIPMVGMVMVTSTDGLGNVLGISRMTDIVIGACGHVGILVSGAPNSTTNGLPTSRCLSAVVGCLNGMIVSCSTDATAL